MAMTFVAAAVMPFCKQSNDIFISTNELFIQDAVYKSIQFHDLDNPIICQNLSCMRLHLLLHAIT